MLPASQKETFEKFIGSAFAGELLDRKTTVMIQLSAALVIGCQPWMEHLFGVAKEEGLTDEEIGAVQAVAMGVSAGRIRAQFQQARKNIGYE